MSGLDCVIANSLAEARRQATLYSEATMTSTVIVTRRTTVGALDYSTGLVVDAPTTIYSGKARLSRLRGNVAMDLGDEQEYFTMVTVSIPLTAPLVIIDDMVEISASPDPHVVTRLFRVTDTEGGGDLPTAQTFNGLGVARSRTNT
jgi:hypothetical protein